ncbi:hypothetical protein ABZV34_34240 [Streptomyces sp. NPDC005195]|uniref:hypothetical protein n=1 Tax=Streptomyces sp. NPDC005195 TaxID=3154561 RepID=UPI0033B9596F
MSLPEQDPRAKTPPVAWSVALRGAVRGKAVAQTTTAALIVGSTLFMVNLYSQVREAPFTWALTARVALTFLVPWFNATMGIVIGLRKSDASPHRRPGPADRATLQESAPPSP